MKEDPHVENSLTLKSKRVKEIIIILVSMRMKWVLHVICSKVKNTKTILNEKIEILGIEIRIHYKTYFLEDKM